MLKNKDFKIIYYNREPVLSEKSSPQVNTTVKNGLLLLTLNPSITSTADQNLLLFFFFFLIFQRK